MPARQFDLDPALGAGSGRTLALVASADDLYRQEARGILCGILCGIVGREARVAQPLKTRLAFTSYRRATWLTEMPGRRVCPQISRFSSSLQAFRFRRSAIPNLDGVHYPVVDTIGRRLRSSERWHRTFTFNLPQTCAELRQAPFVGPAVQTVAAGGAILDQSEARDLHSLTW